MRKVGGGFLSVSVFLGAFRDGGKKGVFWWSGSEVAEGMGCDAGVWGVLGMEERVVCAGG